MNASVLKYILISNFNEIILKYVTFLYFLVISCQPQKKKKDRRKGKAGDDDDDDDDDDSEVMQRLKKLSVQASDEDEEEGNVIINLVFASMSRITRHI